MAWISVDELLEIIMLKLYKQWERRLLSQVRPSLDVGRLELANALRTIASAHVVKGEDSIILFLERLGSMEAVVAAAPEEFILLPELKQALVRARRPGMRLRGLKVKPTNLTPARMQTLLSLLEALDPPAYAVTRMFLPEDLVALATLFEAALLQVFTNWEKLALETRGAILRLLHTVRAQLTSEDGHSFVTVRSVVETLHQFESMPEVMQVSRDAFLAGKMDNAAESPFRFNEMVPVSERLAKMISTPPPVSASATPADPSLPTPEWSPMPDLPGESPEGEEPTKEPEPTPDPGPVEPVGPSLSLYTTRPSSAVVERDFYTDVRFPQQVRLGDEAPLVVRLTRSPFALSRSEDKVKVAFGQPDQPEYVEVVVIAHGFGEATATWSRTMAVYVDRDSQPAIFLLRAQGDLGEQRVTLDFYHKGRYLGSAAFVTRIVEQVPNAVGGVIIDTPALAARFVEQPPPPADLELRIVRGSRENVLYFMLHSTRSGVGYHWKPVGKVKLNSSSPQSYLQSLFASLGNLAAHTVDQLSEADARIAMGDIASIGQQLYKELFPPELQHELWTRILPKRRDASHPDGIISTLLITSDEPWIPWEMVKPYRIDPDTGMEQSAGYLSETFQVTRWLAGRSPAHQVHVKQASIVAPQNDLLYAQREEAYFRQLPARRVQVSGPLRSTADVRQMAQAGGVQLLHFAAHGRFDPDNANLSPLSLQDGALTPFDLAGERAAGLRRERPLVFLNACHTARMAFALTGLGGWAERLVADLNVSAFIGTLWEVNDLLAAEFAIAFYDRLLAGDTLGQAFYTARLHVRDRQPANPTWLAYVLYADPNSVVLWGMGDDEGEPREKVTEEAPTPVEPPKPTFDPDELKAALETYLASTLPDLVRRGIAGVVDQAVTRAMGGEEQEGEEGEGKMSEEKDATEEGGESGQRLDSMLFLNALASSQGEGDTTMPSRTPNGLHAHEAETNHADESHEGDRSELNNRGADENDTSKHGPRAPRREPREDGHAMTTPMRQQYLSLKSQYPDCILLFRLGDFYETFDDDAKIIAKVCDVVLTSRPVGNDQRVPLAGVPYHSVEGYIARLIEAGYRVAIADQVSEPGKGLVEREVTRVITKGTLVEPGMLDEKRNNYLAAVSFNSRGSVAGLAYADITTGEFAATELGGALPAEIERRVGEELSRLQPSELIAIDWQPTESSLHGLIDLLHPVISSVEAWQTAPDTAYTRLLRHFQVATLDGFGLHQGGEAVRAAAGLLTYLQAMQPGALKQMTRLASYTVGEFMTLDEATRRNLELTETLRGNDTRGSLLGVLDRTLTPMGGRLLRRWLNQPLLDVAAIQRRLDIVEFFIGNTSTRLELRELLREMGDLERWTNRVTQAVALPRDLVGIRTVLAQVPALCQIVAGETAGMGWNGHATSHSASQATAAPLPLPTLPLCEPVLETLMAAIADEPPATLSTPGIIRPGFRSELDELVNHSRYAKDWIANLERTERERLDIKSLKVGYNKVFGYYIEITNTHGAKAPPDYIRKQTLANAERYITPDLKEYEALVLNADERRLDIEQQLFSELCSEVAAHASDLLALAAALAEFDVYSALAEVALSHRYVRPEVDEGPSIEIAGGRHPVVELMLTDEPFVPNDTHLTPDACIHLLTGPNMAGKSTFLRQTALITLMAQIGSFVPADAARIGVVDRIFTRIGASDEIHRGQSTFMVEMVETANILNHATRRSLLVLDEIGRGTSTYDGLAIAWAVIEYIHNHPELRAKTLFATHYHELTDLPERLPHVVNYNVAVDDSGNQGGGHENGGGEDVVFLRRIIPGKADRSYGVHVARLAGLPSAAVARAEEILGELERSGAAGPKRLFDAVTSKAGTKGKSAALQTTLFADIHPVVEALRQLDVNGLTPLEALNRLYELQQLAKRN